MKIGTLRKDLDEALRAGSSGFAAAEQSALRSLRGAFEMLNARDGQTLAMVLATVPADRQFLLDRVLADLALVPALGEIKSRLPSKRRKAFETAIKILEDYAFLRKRYTVAETGESQRAVTVPLSSTKARKPKTMDQNLIDRAAAALEAALGDNDRFDAALNEIERNSAIRQRELAAIANLFYGRTAADTSRNVSIRRIRSRQQSLMDFKAKSAAQSGKSAA